MSENIDSGPLCAQIPGWFAPPRGLQEIIRCFGDVRVAVGQVVAPPYWESENMGMFYAPWMPAGKLYVNKKVWPMLKAAIEACLSLNDGYLIKTLGCFSPRLKRVNGDLSTHSWAISFDLNAAQNPLQEIGGPVICDIPDTWIAIFKTMGWVHGRDFSGRKDPMHFQWCQNY